MFYKYLYYVVIVREAKVFTKKRMKSNTNCLITFSNVVIRYNWLYGASVSRDGETEVNVGMCVVVVV